MNMQICITYTKNAMYVKFWVETINFENCAQAEIVQFLINSEKGA